MNYFLVDAEFTGLETDRDHILEISYMILDENFSSLCSKRMLIKPPLNYIELMGEFVKKLHTDSGLVDELKNASQSYTDVEETILKDLKIYTKEQEIHFLGNSIYMDVSFFKKYLPRIVNWMHYRLIDVSTLKVLIQQWYKDNPYAYFKKSNKHRADLDIEETLAELLYYKKQFFK